MCTIPALIYKSPYTGQRADIVCGDKEASYILPLNLVAHYPKISSLFEYWSDKIPLKDVNAAVGHIIVHFLYTGTYQCLQPEESSTRDKKRVEFKTSIRAYIAARAYGIPVLAKLASLEAEILGDDLDFSTIVDLLEETYARPPIDDAWISEYIRNRISGILSQPRMFSSEDKSKQNTSIAQICVESMMVITRDNLNAHSFVEVPPEQDQDDAVRSKDSSESIPAPIEYSRADIPDDCSGSGVGPEPEDQHSRESIAEVEHYPEVEPLEPVEEKYPSPDSIPAVEEENFYSAAFPAPGEVASVCTEPPIAEHDEPEAESLAGAETQSNFPESPVTGVQQYPLRESTVREVEEFPLQEPSVFKSADDFLGEPSVPDHVEEPLSEEPMPLEADILLDEGCEQPVVYLGYDQVPETSSNIGPADGALGAEEVNHDPTWPVRDSPLCTHGTRRKRCFRCKKARKSFEESMTWN